GLISGRVRRQERCETDGFLADVRAHQLFACGCLVAFVEQEVERVQHATQTLGQFGPAWNLESNALLANFLLGASQALGHSGLSGEKGAADFGNAESAKGF